MITNFVRYWISENRFSPFEVGWIQATLWSFLQKYPRNKMQTKQVVWNRKWTSLNKRDNAVSVREQHWVLWKNATSGHWLDVGLFRTEPLQVEMYAVTTCVQWEQACRQRVGGQGMCDRSAEQLALTCISSGAVDYELLCLWACLACWLWVVSLPRGNPHYSTGRASVVWEPTCTWWHSWGICFQSVLLNQTKTKVDTSLPGITTFCSPVWWAEHKAGSHLPVRSVSFGLFHF